jgi:tetratricopeptide (TPR) repeat protein
MRDHRAALNMPTALRPGQAVRSSRVKRGIMHGSFLAVLVALLVILSVSPTQIAAQGHDDHDGHGDNIGTAHFATSCNPAAQQHFDRGVTLLHSFWFAPAREAFTAAANADDGCGIAHWGVAMTYLDNPLGGVIPPANVQPGQAAVEQANKIGASTKREQAYIAAIEAMYKDATTVDFRTRALAYEQAMEQLHLAHPDDQEAAIFYALALNITALPTDKTFSNTLKAAKILEGVSVAQPDHPAIAHYLIHSYDYPPIAHQGLGAARRYAGIAPAVPHAQHMPSHIFTRLGYWDESVAANKEAFAAAMAGAGQLQPGVAPVDALHAMDYLTYAYLQMAQDEKARSVLDEIMVLQKVPERGPEAYALAAIPTRLILEQGRWSDAAALSLHPSGYAWDRFPHAEAVLVFARGLGAARSGDVESARRDADRLAELSAALVAQKQPYWVEQVDIQRQLVLAVGARAEGQDQEALRLLREAVVREAATDKHPITPGPLVPASELLGEVLLELNAPAEALAAFEAVQANEPNRFRAIYGAGRAAELAGDLAKARTHYAALVALAEQADTERPELTHARAFVAQR